MIRSMATEYAYGELFYAVIGGEPTIGYWHGPSGGRRGAPGANPVETLNMLGAQGWRVVGVSESTRGVRYVMIRSGE
jgi:hypothetical protein